MSINKETFAKWSFDHDKELGKYTSRTRWFDLPKSKQEEYLEEARHYIEEVDEENWPVDILEKLEDDS
jgi:hypothetical protein